MTFGSRTWSKPAVCEPGEAWQTRTSVVVDPQPPLGRQAAEPVDPLRPERLVGPLGRRAERVGDAVGEPRERGRVVEVGDGDVGVALDDERAVGLELADAVDRGGRIGPVHGEVAGDEDRVRLRGADGLPDGVEGDRVAVDVAEQARSGPSAEDRCVRDDEAEGRLAGDLAVDRGDRPGRARTARPSLSIVTSSRSVSPGTTTRLKRHSSIPPNSPIRSPNPGCLAT